MNGCLRIQGSLPYGMRTLRVHRMAARCHHSDTPNLQLYTTTLYRPYCRLADLALAGRAALLLLLRQLPSRAARTVEASSRSGCNRARLQGRLRFGFDAAAWPDARVHVSARCEQVEQAQALPRPFEHVVPGRWERFHPPIGRGPCCANLRRLRSSPMCSPLSPDHPPAPTPCSSRCHSPWGNAAAVSSHKMLSACLASHSRARGHSAAA